MAEWDAGKFWSNSVGERLGAARSLSQSELTSVRDRLHAGCPYPRWPYGYSTSISPLLVTLGISPSRSGDSAKAFSPPTAGTRHPHTTCKESPTEFWRMIRHLARTILQLEDLAEEDAYALFGNVVLNPWKKSADADIRPEFGRWVLRTIRDDLCPRYLICLGMKDKKNKKATALMEETFDGFEREKGREHPLGCDSRYSFEEWDCSGRCGNMIKIVYWPQVPKRPPLKSFKDWQDACKQFADCHRGLLRA